MSLLTKPQARVALGWATVGGQRVPIQIDIEWDRFLDQMAERSGGVSGVGTTELTAEAFEDAGIEELKAGAYLDRDSAGQTPPFVQLPADDSQAPTHTEHIAPREDPSGELSALREEVFALRSRLESIEQGTSL